MITLYHLRRSRSERIAWLLEELGIDYHLECIDRVDGRYAPQSLKNVHPLGRAPAIRDGDLVLAESGAIVDYILARHGNGRFRIHYQETGFAEYLYWFHYAEASLMLQLLRESSLVRIVPDVDRHAGMDKVRLTTREHLEFIGRIGIKMRWLKFISARSLASSTPRPMVCENNIERPRRAII